MLESLNQFTKFLFILMLLARISVSQPKESKDAAKCATKCVNDMEKLAQLKQACKTMTLSKCIFDARTERIPKSGRRCFRVNAHRSSTQIECVQVLRNTTSQIKYCSTFVYFCIYQKDGAHSIQKRDITAEQNITNTPRANTTKFSPTAKNISLHRASALATSPNSAKTSTTTTQPTEQSTSHTSSTPNTAFMTLKDFFGHWKNACYVAVGGLVLILAIVVVLCKCRKRKNSGINTVEIRSVVSPTSTLGESEVESIKLTTELTHTVEVRSVSPTPTPVSNEVQLNSPIYCETDTFQFPSSQPRGETNETVEAEVSEPTDVENNSEDEYCCPENIEDEYETMNSVVPPQASGVYAYAYDHVNINASYVNTFPHQQQTSGVEDDDYEYPQNRRSSSDNEYRYAYDWLDPGARVAALSASEPVEDENYYENCQTLLQNNLEKENEIVTLEYVAVL
ncbi:Hypothetical predicted protein [Paramuricea clavata]|uniref:Uncharacterized protein n=1 Tax=Paramuricea clavata TaxID=317549 RepID=A0A6S7H5X7_PARCT|nr:Hypothetical predicted protein [Paramuricea clavata]